MFANAAGRHLVKDFFVLRDVATKQRLGCQGALDLDLTQQRAARWQRPAPNHPPLPSVPRDERGALGAHIEAAHKPRLDAANQADDVDGVFAIAKPSSQRLQPPLAATR